MEARRSMGPFWWMTALRMHHISSRVSAIFSDTIHWSCAWQLDSGGLRMILIMSHGCVTWTSFDLKPQHAANQSTFAAGHLKNKWEVDSTSCLQRTHHGSEMSIRVIRFSLVGSVLAATLHRNILSLSGPLIFQIFDQFIAEDAWPRVFVVNSL